MKRSRAVLAAGAVLAVSAAALVVPRALEAPSADELLARDSVRGPLTGERFYFVLPDRFADGDPSNNEGGITGGRTDHGYDPTDLGFFHGGDLAGLTQRLDYLEGLGVSAVWLTPVMRNQPVQGEPGEESAAYHGYWVTDFTAVDPHLGTLDELEELIRLAHERDLKVFLDIITNHTADVIDYAEGEQRYRPLSEEPYTPVLDPGEEDLKAPDWLNDPARYHNRGNSTFEGESSLYGDFVGLDDLATEQPEVVEGMIRVYQDWVDVGVDGFRIDTVKHVDLEFWTRFGPALMDHAARVGNEDFFMFGEVYDANPVVMSEYSTAGRLPATLDFGFQAAATAYARGESAQTIAGLFAGDDWYTDADSNAYALPTFLGNHDMGRFAQFLGGAAILHGDLPDRVAFGHTLMFLTRGQPVVYYGDEQGFIGRRGDKEARQDMFATQVGQFAREEVVTGEPGSRDRYDEQAPLYRHIAELAALREAHPALADGAQVTRYAADGPGVFAFSRLLPADGIEYLVAVNNDVEPATARVRTYGADLEFRPVYGDQQPRTSDPDGYLEVEVPALSAVVYRAAERAPGVAEPLGVTVSAGELTGRPELAASLSPPVEGAAVPFAQVTFAVRPVGGAADWRVVGTDDAPPYRVFPHASLLPEGPLEVRAVARPLDGPVSGASVATSPPSETAPSSAAPPPGEPTSVSLPGSFNPALGCDAEWDPACEEAAMRYDEGSGTWTATFDLPAGRYEFKVAIGGTWDENYGADGARGGANIPFPHRGGEVRFVYDSATHRVTVEPVG